MTKVQKKLTWRQGLHLSLDSVHESHFRSKYGGRDIAWLQITPCLKGGGFGKPRNYFVDMTLDPKTRPEHRELSLLIAAIDKDQLKRSAKVKKK